MILPWNNFNVAALRIVTIKACVPSMVGRIVYKKYMDASRQIDGKVC